MTLNRSMSFKITLVNWTNLSDLANFLVYEANGKLPACAIQCWWDRLVLLSLCAVLSAAINWRPPEQNNNSNILYFISVLCILFSVQRLLGECYYRLRSVYGMSRPSVVFVCLWRSCSLLTGLYFSAIFLLHLIPYGSDNLY